MTYELRIVQRCRDGTSIHALCAEVEISTAQQPRVVSAFIDQFEGKITLTGINAFRCLSLAEIMVSLALPPTEPPQILPDPAPAPESITPDDL